MKGYHGPAIYHYRKLRKVNQKWLAQFLSMTRQNLSDIERNKCKISEQRLVIVAQRLEVTVADIKQFNAEAPTMMPADYMSTAAKPPDHAFVTVSAALLHGIKAYLEILQKAYVLILGEEAERENSRPIIVIGL